MDLENKKSLLLFVLAAGHVLDSPMLPSSTPFYSHSFFRPGCGLPPWLAFGSYRG
jgi:hypothetical protein